MYFSFFFFFPFFFPFSFSCFFYFFFFFFFSFFFFFLFFFFFFFFIFATVLTNRMHQHLIQIINLKTFSTNQNLITNSQHSNKNIPPLLFSTLTTPKVQIFIQMKNQLVDICCTIIAIIFVIYNLVQSTYKSLTKCSKLLTSLFTSYSSTSKQSNKFKYQLNFLLKNVKMQQMQMNCHISKTQRLKYLMFQVLKSCRQKTKILKTYTKKTTQNSSFNRYIYKFPYKIIRFKNKNKTNQQQNIHYTIKKN
eukprot:TRINITY_DN8116_c0_g1_i9.p2 TRINITY_DN8116_c0_g1~~TRINITY_DN8116_c0_g1_i9.p2  ORF type:complete len:257 (+),score=-24.13 TRINITY_DN8116_c0_g1_i9:27-773(+)